MSEQHAQLHRQAALKHEDAMNAHARAAEAHEQGNHVAGMEFAHEADLRSDEAKQRSSQAKIEPGD